MTERIAKAVNANQSIPALHAGILILDEYLLTCIPARQIAYLHCPIEDKLPLILIGVPVHLTQCPWLKMDQRSRHFC